VITNVKLKRIFDKRLPIKIYYRLIMKSFKMFEKYLKIHLTPVHFNSPIPIVHKLKDNIYEKVFECTGIEWNIDGQKRNLKYVFSKYIDEFIPEKGRGLSLVDAFILYAMVREKKPKNMIEVGSGMSTFITLAALEKNINEGFPCKFTAIEPYPIQNLKDIKVEGFSLVESKVQDVPLRFFADIDLLFIDSTHVSKIDSDVNYEMLEIVPSLKEGALIHWHDILIPQNYWKDWIDNGNKFWNESYLLHAFLQFNSKFHIQWASRYMHLNYRALIQERFSYFTDDARITSLWLLKGNPTL